MKETFCLTCMGIVNFQKQKSATFALTKAAYSKFQWTLFFQKVLQSVLQDQYDDDDTRVDHSDVTATSSKLPYKAAFPPNKGIKKKLWSTQFFRFNYLFRYRHVIWHLSQ